MYTQLKIINLALGKLSNGNFVQSLEEDSPEAHQMLTHWETTLHTVLSEYAWDFARKLERLTPLDEDTAISGWKYHYIYPNDCVFIRRVYPASTPYGNSPFRLGQSNGGTQRIIMTNHDQAAVEYTMAEPIPENMPPQFVNALAWRLASEISLASYKEPQMAQACMQAYMQAIEEAKLRDAREAGPLSKPNGNWLASRQILNTENQYTTASPGAGQ